MMKILTKFKNAAVIGMIGAAPVAMASTNASESEPVKTTTTVSIDTAARRELMQMLDKQYADIAEVLKTLTIAMNRPDVDRHSKSYADMVKMHKILMAMIKTRIDLTNTAKLATGNRNLEAHEPMHMNWGGGKPRVAPQKTR